MFCPSCQNNSSAAASSSCSRTWKGVLSRAVHLLISCYLASHSDPLCLLLWFQTLLTSICCVFAVQVVQQVESLRHIDPFYTNRSSVVCALLLQRRCDCWRRLSNTIATSAWTWFSRCCVATRTRRAVIVSRTSSRAVAATRLRLVAADVSDDRTWLEFVATTASSYSRTSVRNRSTSSAHCIQPVFYILYTGWAKKNCAKFFLQ